MFGWARVAGVRVTSQPAVSVYGGPDRVNPYPRKREPLYETHGPSIGWWGEEVGPLTCVVETVVGEMVYAHVSTLEWDDTGSITPLSNSRVRTPFSVRNRWSTGIESRKVPLPRCSRSRGGSPSTSSRPRGSRRRSWSSMCNPSPGEGPGSLSKRTVSGVVQRSRGVLTDPGIDWT